MELKRRNVLSMHGFANHTQRSFEIAIGRFEGVSVDGQGSAEDDKRGTVFGALDVRFHVIRRIMPIGAP